MLSAGTCPLLHGLRSSCVCASRGKCCTFNPQLHAFLFSCFQSYVSLVFSFTFHLSPSLHSFCNLWLSAKATPWDPRPAVEVSTTTALTRGCHSHSCALLLARQPRVCAFAGQRWSPPVLGSFVTDHPACYHLLPGCFGCMFTRQDRGLELCCRFPGSHSNQAAEPWCHSSATWPRVPHTCAGPIRQHFRAMVQQLPSQLPQTELSSTAWQLGLPRSQLLEEFSFSFQWRDNVFWKADG